MESNFIDWHPADIIAGLRKKGTSMAAESRRKPWELTPGLSGHHATMIRRPMSLSTERS